MTRKELLDAAAGCVLHDRANQYGDVEDNFGRIAELWTKYLGVQLAPHDVAAMMVLLKIARLRANPHHDDSWVDLAGYAACGAECAGAAKTREEAVHEAGEEYRRLKAEGVEELVVSPFDAPQTKEELYSKILESNPATFRPRTPTGEELAEMAQEDAHG